MRALPAVLVVVMLPCLAGCNCGDPGGGDAGPQGVLEAAIADGTGSLMLLQLDGGVSLLVDHALNELGFLDNPRWDPAGTRLAFTNGSLAFVREGTGTVREALPRDTGDYYAGARRVEWSRDGRWLALDGDATNETSGVFLVSQDGGLPAYIETNGAWAFEPGGSGVLFDDTATSTTGALTRRLDPETGAPSHYLDERLLDATAKGVAVQRCADPGDGGSECEVLLLRPDQSSAVLVPRGPFRVSERSLTTLTLSPYAEEAAVELVSELTGAARLVRARAGGALTVVAEASDPYGLPGCHRFLPGGATLSLVDPSVGEVVLVAPDGGQARLATPGLEPDGLGCLDWRVRP